MKEARESEEQGRREEGAAFVCVNQCLLKENFKEQQSKGSFAVSLSFFQKTTPAMDPPPLLSCYSSLLRAPACCFSSQLQL